MIVNKQNLGVVFTGLKTIFQDAYESYQPQWDKVATLVPSATAQETYAWLGSFTKFREWIGDRIIQNLSASSYTIINKTFENTVGVDRETIEDDTYGIYNPIMKQLGMDTKRHPDELVFSLLANGLTGLCYDGQPFFSATHPVRDANGKAQNVSNYDTGALPMWMLLDVSNAIKPVIFQKRRDYAFVAMDKMDDESVFTSKTFRYGVDARVNVGYGLWQMAHAAKVDLTVTNYAAARAAMTGRKGDGGKPLSLRPDLLIVPPALEKIALDIVKADVSASGATNTLKGSAEVLVCPYLS